MKAFPSSFARRATRRTAPHCFAVGVVLLALAGCDSSDRADRPAATADPASDNWNFERGDFTGWRTLAFGSGAWHVYASGSSPPDPKDTDPDIAFDVPGPPQGGFAAVTDMRSPGTRILHRKLRIDVPSKLRMTLFYESPDDMFASPPTLDFHGETPNRQFRVELLDPVAPVTSMKAGDRLATIFRTAPGDPSSMRPRAVTLDLSPWAGKTVRLRLAQVDNGGPLRAGVDDIRVQATGREP